MNTYTPNDAFGMNLSISRFLLVSLVLLFTTVIIPVQQTAQAYYGGSLPAYNGLYGNGGINPYNQNPAHGLPNFLSPFSQFGNSLPVGGYGGAGLFGGGIYGGFGLYGGGIGGGLYGNWSPILYLSSPPVSPNNQEAILLMANNYLQSLSKAPVITAQELYALISDVDPGNDPLIISVRKPEDYQKGHIPGAINIPYQLIAAPENLGKLPQNRLIVTYCYTGHTGAVAATVLNLLGYKAVTLKFGIMSWTIDPIVRVAAPFIEGIDSCNFPISYGANP